MKIAVLGAGAIGSSIGGMLARAGEDVVLIGRKEHVDAINRNGLIVDGVLGELRIRLKAVERLDFKPELVLLAVKSQDLVAAAKEIEPYGSSVPVVTVQNGVQCDHLAAEILGTESIVGCVATFASTFQEPGRITYHYITSGNLILGEPFGPNGQRVEDLAALLNKAMPTIISEDIRGTRWTKLFANTISPLMALTGLCTRVQHYYGLRRLHMLLTREMLAATQKAGIPIRQDLLPSLSIEEMLSAANLPLAVAAGRGQKRSSQRRGQGDGERFTSSIHQSIMRGKPTEIDYINGEIVRLGKKVGIPTPYNARIVELIHEQESTGKYYSVRELLAAVKAGF